MPLSDRSKNLLLGAIGLAALGVAVGLDPIPQEASYHDFADRRSLLGLPHALNVLSNLPFVLVGALGLVRLFSRRTAPAFREPWERWPYALVLASVFMVGWGSFYYHGNPHDASLFWDRLPMTTLFTSILGVGVIERISARWGRRLILPLVALGIWTLLYGQTRNDFRFYGVLQGLAMAGVPLLLLLFPPRYTRSGDLWVAVALYGVAKACEALDSEIYALLQGTVSGHTLKHLLGAASAWKIVSMIGRRRPAPAPDRSAVFVEERSGHALPKALYRPPGHDLKQGGLHRGAR